MSVLAPACDSPRYHCATCDSYVDADHGVCDALEPLDPELFDACSDCGRMTCHCGGEL